MMTISDTSLTLLASLRDPADNDAWRRFDQRYRRLLVQFAKSVGLDHHEADEVAQQTLIAFSQANGNGQYDRRQGKFRNWLLGIAQHKIADLRAQRKRQPLPIGTPKYSPQPLPHLPDPRGFSAIWDREWEAFVKQACFENAAARFTRRDMRIFERLTLHQQSVETIANDSALSNEAVRQIRHRVLSFMRSVLYELENAT